MKELQARPNESPFSDRVQKILIAEDDTDQRELLSIRFQEHHFEVFQAKGVSEAMQLALEHRPDAIVMDVQLPDGSGMDLCGQLTDDPKTADIPVVILTGCCDADVVRKARSAGSSFFLHKPFDPSALLLLVNQAIEDSRSWM